MKTGLESLEVGAPDITYSGNQGPKSPQEDQRMMQEHLISQIEEEYSRHVFEMEEQGLQPMSMQEFMQQVLAEGQMSSNEEPTMGDMAGGENDRVRELLLLEETQGLSEEEKEELRQLIKTISAQMPQGDMPMDMEQDPRTMAAGGGIMDTEKGFAMQAGVKNYLGKQKTVSDVPVKWQSGKDKPSTELAYITDAEKKLLLKEDIHGSLKDGPNTGPEGIMSLDSQGDMGGSEDKGTGGSDGYGGGYGGQATEQGGGGDGGVSGEQARAAAAAAARAEAAKAAANTETEAEKIARLALIKKEEEEQAKRTATFLPSSQAFNLYDVDQSNKSTMLGLGVDPRMFAADGGRMEYAGGLGVLRGKLSNQQFGYDEDEEDIKKLAFGGLAGLPPVTMQTEGQNIQSFPDDESMNMAQGPQNPMPMPMQRPMMNQPMMNQQMMNPQMAGLMASRQAAAFGGLMGEDGRRAYGFGSIGRIFKKVTSLPRKLVKTVKKISKSKFGKMALMAAAMYYAPALATKMGGAGMPTGSFMQTLASGNRMAAFKTLMPGGVSPFSGQQSTLFNFMKPGVKDIVKNVVKDKAKKSFFSPSNVFMGITGLSGLAGLSAAKQGQEPLDEATSRENDFNPFDEYGGVAGLRKKVLAGNLDRGEFAFQQQPMYAANGGRIGYQDAGPVIDQETQAMILDMNNRGMDIDTISTITQQDAATINAILSAQNQKAMGGRMGYAEGGESELLDMGGMEKDYRNDGGFVPMGEYERKDDVPARLSKNEFVFTADAVRNAGGGDIDKGAEIMENMMENLEAGGKVSKGSQGLSGAREMFQTQQRLGEVL